MSGTRTIIVSFVMTVILINGGAGRARAGLVSQWLFDETGGSIAHDSVDGIDGSLSGGAAFDPGAGPGSGIYGGAISLSSTTDSYVDMGTVYPFTGGDFSIVLWMKTDQAAAPPDISQGQIVLAEHHTGYANGYFFAINNVNDGLASAGSHFYASSSSVKSTENVNDGEWHQLAVSYQSGSMSYYIDGTLVSTGVGNPISGNDAPFMVGGVDYFGTLSGTYTGLVSDVSAYDTALSGSDVHSIYEQVINSQSIPEPSSLVMGIIGLGLAGGAAMLKRHRARGRAHR